MARGRFKTDNRRGDPYLDRRSGEDRRQVHNLRFFLKGGTENRNDRERRGAKERRKGWIRVTKWSSVCAKPLQNLPF